MFIKDNTHNFDFCPLGDTFDGDRRIGDTDMGFLGLQHFNRIAGSLSQDDIDSLLGGGDDEADEDMELVSQDDIDRLMNPSDEDGETEQGDDTDDDELISMDDIQGLLESDTDAGVEKQEAPSLEAKESDPDPSAALIVVAGPP